MDDEIHLFIDDTGSRDSNKKPNIERRDGLDCFGLGGVMINYPDVDIVWQHHQAFCKKWNIDYPLHSHEIRGGRQNFKWLKNPEIAAEFMPDFTRFLTSLPVIGIAAIIDRPGYVKRYHDKYDGNPWHMDKTALTILLERAAKYADSRGKHLRVFFEQCGRNEDTDLKQHAKNLKIYGMPFSTPNPDYKGLVAADFKRIIRGEPREKTKKMAQIQIADLYLYPMAKGGYDPEYRPYKQLKVAGKIIDAWLTPEDIPNRGIKYSCFSCPKNDKGPR